MSREIRSDKKRNLAKVSEALIKDPHATLGEIAEQSDLGTSTVKRAKDDLAINGKKDDTITIIVNDAKDRIKKVGKIFNALVQETYDKYYDENGVRKPNISISRDDEKLLKDYVKDDLQRVTVFGGDITDAGGGLKEVRSILDDIID